MNSSSGWPSEHLAQLVTFKTTIFRADFVSFVDAASISLPMTRSFYSAAIAFIGIYVALALFQSILFLHLGAGIYDVPSVALWLVFLYLVGFTWSTLMLKYYHAKGYLFAFWACAASMGASLIQFYLFYDLLTTRQLSPSYVVATVLLVATGILYALALVFSPAAERQWLKIAGVVHLFVGALMSVSFAWAIASVSARVNGTIVMLEQCISVIGSLSPLLFVFNFMSERVAAGKTVAVHAGNWQHAVGIAAMTTFAAARNCRNGYSRRNASNGFGSSTKHRSPSQPFDAVQRYIFRFP